MGGFSNGLANPDDYIIGRGTLYFAEVNAAGFPLAFRDLGNAPEFSANLESEDIEHQSSRAGLKVTDKKVVVSLTANISFTLDEINFDNLALFLSGETASFAQAGGAITGTENLTISTPTATRPELALGRWYDLYMRADMSSGTSYPGGSADVRAYNIDLASTIAVQVAGGGPTLTKDTDYAVDEVMGRIYIYDTAANRTTFISGGALQNVDLDVDFTPKATTIEEARGLTKSSIAGALKFVQINAADNSLQAEHQFHSVTLSPEGDLSLIGDDFTGMQFTGQAEAREAVDPNAPVVRTRTYDGAGQSS